MGRGLRPVKWCTKGWRNFLWGLLVGGGWVRASVHRAYQEFCVTASVGRMDMV